MRILRKVKPKIDHSKLKYQFYVIDTETTSLEPQPKNFVFGVIYGFNSCKVIKSVEQFKEELRLICFAVVVESIENLYYKEIDSDNTDSVEKMANTIENMFQHRTVCSFPWHSTSIPLHLTKGAIQ